MTRAGAVHHCVVHLTYRMPVILAKDDEATWLNPDETESEPLLSYLRPLPANALRSERL
jgi:putative SOS response-associated peptidase YedK